MSPMHKIVFEIWNATDWGMSLMRHRVLVKLYQKGNLLKF